MSIIAPFFRIPFLRRPLYNALYSYIACRQRSRFKNLTNQIKALKDIHHGEACFIIGTGPSLTIDDLKTISSHGWVTFAPNRIYELCEQYDWKPTYYICQDHNIIKTFAERIARINADMMFLPIEYHDRFKDDNYKFFVIKEHDFYPHKAQFSKDLSKYIAQGYTVTYGAIQLAVYMGFKTIYLLGIDHNYNISRDAKGRPCRDVSSQSNYTKGMSNYINDNNLPRIEESTIAYETAEIVAAKMGVKIYNATRGGKLEAFERINFDDIFKSQI